VGARHLFGRPLGDDPAPLVAPFGTHIDDIVGVLDHIEVVLDDDDAVAQIDEVVEDAREPVDIGEVEPCGGFVEDIKGVAGIAAAELLGELDPLRFPAAERRGVLPEGDVVEPHIHEGLELGCDRRDRLEELHRFTHAHSEDIGDVLPFVEYFEGLGVVARAVAPVAAHHDIGEEVHLDLDLAVPLALLTATTLDIERKPPDLVAAQLRLLGLGEEFPYLVHDPGICSRVGARGAPDGALVEIDHLVELLQPRDLDAVDLVDLPGVVEYLAGCGEEGLEDQRALAAAANPGDTDEIAQRDAGGEVVDVVEGDILDLEPVLLGLVVGVGDDLLAVEVVGGEGLGFGELLRYAAEYYIPAVLAGTRPDIDDIVGGDDGLLVVLDDDDAVPFLAERLEGADELHGIALVQTDARLVEDIHHPRQPRSDL